MKKSYLFLIAIYIMIISCHEKESNDSGYEVNLNMSGFDDGTEFKLLHIDDEKLIDSVKIHYNKLKFKGNATEPFSARIQTIDNKSLIFWVENGVIDIQGSSEDFSNPIIVGTQLNKVYVKYRDKQKAFRKKRDSLLKIYMQMVASQTLTESEGARLSDQMKLIDKNTFKIRMKSIETEPPSIYTIKELYFLRNDIQKDSLKLLFNKFPKEYQSSKYGQVVETYIQNESIGIGKRYKDISGMNFKGEHIKLSELEGNYILLDFWASWCMPCREENPNYVKVYDKYKDKGFEIYSFSIDDNAKAWKKASEVDSIYWKRNVIAEKGSYSKMAALYNVRAVPSSFLINPEGIVIATDLRGKDLEDRLIFELDKRIQSKN